MLRSPAIGSARAAYLLPLWLQRSMLPAPGAASERGQAIHPAVSDVTCPMSYIFD
ncbi:MAG: hypothetical protein AB9879_10010 [Methanothrix sp.]